MPILCFLFFLKKCKTERLLWIIVSYELYNYLTDIGLLYLNHRPAKIFLYSSFTFFEYILFALGLFNIIQNKKFRLFILLTSIAFSIFLLIYNLKTKVLGLDSVPIGIETILILIFSFYYFYEQMQDTNNLFIYSRYSFWVVLGMILYLAGSFFIYIYSSQLSQEEVNKYWVFTNIFSILKNIFFTIAIIVNANQSVKKTPKKYKLYPSNQFIDS